MQNLTTTGCLQFAAKIAGVLALFSGLMALLFFWLLADSSAERTAWATYATASFAFGGTSMLGSILLHLETYRRDHSM